MLKEFSIVNCFSFREKLILSTKATRITEFDEINCFKVKNEKFLKVLSIHGLNGSGKSNIIKALFYFQRLVLNSHIIKIIK